MPAAAPRPCTAPRCTALATSGSRCPAHPRPEWRHDPKARKRYDETRGTAASRGYDSKWSKLRRVVLTEEPLCRMCREGGRVTAATMVDHILPKRQGGMDDRDNLQPLCHPCHTRKTLRDGSYGTRRKQP